MPSRPTRSKPRVLDRPRYDQDNQPRTVAWFEPNGCLVVESTYKDGSKGVEVYGKRTVEGLRKLLGVDTYNPPATIQVGPATYRRVK